MLDFTMKDKGGIWCQGVVWDDGSVSLSNGLHFISFREARTFCGKEVKFCIPGIYVGLAEVVEEALMLCPGKDKYPRMTVHGECPNDYFVFATGEESGVAFSRDACDSTWVREWDGCGPHGEDFLGSDGTWVEKCSRISKLLRKWMP